MRRVLGAIQRRPPAARLRADLRALLRWNATLGRFPKVSRGPDATAFVSVYVDGILRGCMASDEGLARAFLRSVHDARHPAIPEADLARAVAILSYARDVRPLDPEAAVKTLEPGTHGLLYVREDSTPAFLLPQVARDHQWNATQLLDGMRAKAGVDVLERQRLFSFETTDLVSTATETRRASPFADGVAFLARLVARDGAITFAIAPRTGARTAVGEMHHGRAAFVVRALEAGGEKALAARARRRLASDLARALAGAPVPGWPTRLDMQCGTLALASLAGVDVRRALLERARAPELAGSVWHAAQVVTALGKDAPRALFAACVANLGSMPWAPWTATAAAAVGDAKVRARCVRALAAAVRKAAPYEGGVAFGSDIPETAITAIAIEALEGAEGTAIEAARARARAHLRDVQILPDRPRGPSLPVAWGGFPLSPVADGLRCDVTAHAVLALAPSRRS